MSEWSAPRDKSVEIWASLCEMYGSKFTNNYGETPPQMWKVTINNFKDFELARGMRKLMFKGSGTPPTLPQFLAACKYSDEEDQASRVDQTALPKPEYNEPIWSHAQKCLMAYLWTKKVPNEIL